MKHYVEEEAKNDPHLWHVTVTQQGVVCIIMLAK